MQEIAVGTSCGANLCVCSLRVALLPFAMSDEDTPGIVIPIIPLDNTVVFPGDSVPLRVFPPSLLRSSSVGQVNMVVGVVCQSDEGLASIGCVFCRPFPLLGRK